MGRECDGSSRRLLPFRTEFDSLATYKRNTGCEVGNNSKPTEFICSGCNVVVSSMDAIYNVKPVELVMDGEGLPSGYLRFDSLPR